MRAAMMRSFSSPLVLETADDPICPVDGVVVEVRATGVCRSDWHAWSGHDPDVALPHVGGHELCGVVVAVGPEVRGWVLGARVTVPFCCSCGVCEPCRLGETQLCDRNFQPGLTAWGSFAQYVALPRADLNLVAVPDALSDAETVVREDVVASIVEATGGGAHVSLDALGAPVTMTNSIECLRKQGRHAQVGLLLGEHLAPPVPMARAIARELKLFGVHGMAVRHYPTMLSAIAGGAVRPGELVAKTIRLEGLSDELASMGSFAQQGVTVVVP